MTSLAQPSVGGRAAPLVDVPPHQAQQIVRVIAQSGGDVAPCLRLRRDL
jgi:hypothetical protein